jgi:hypothetical protein
LFLNCTTWTSRNPTGAAKQEKVYPPNFAEITECRRKIFSANLGVFGASRRKNFCFFFAKSSFVPEFCNERGTATKKAFKVASFIKQNLRSPNTYKVT